MNSDTFISRSSFSNQGSLTRNSSASYHLQASSRQAQQLSSLELIRKRLKVLSMYFVIFSVFILLNACIGFSSAPFYSPSAQCDIYNPSAECKQLEVNSQILYAFELCFSLVLVANGCLVVSLSDNLQNQCLRQLTVVYARVGLVLYPALLLVRAVLYYDVVQRLELTGDILTLYANFFAVYAQSEITQYVVTTVVLCLYLICYVFTYLITKNCSALKQLLDSQKANCIQATLSIDDVLNSVMVAEELMMTETEDQIN